MSFWFPFHIDCNVQRLKGERETVSQYLEALDRIDDSCARPKDEPWEVAEDRILDRLSKGERKMRIK